MFRAVPAVEVADNTDSFRMWRPNGKRKRRAVSHVSEHAHPACRRSAHAYPHRRGANRFRRVYGVNLCDSDFGDGR